VCGVCGQGVCVWGGGQARKCVEASGQIGVMLLRERFHGHPCAAILACLIFWHVSSSCLH
jgi:hypothetical protein